VLLFFFGPLPETGRGVILPRAETGVELFFRREKRGGTIPPRPEEKRSPFPFREGDRGVWFASNVQIVIDYKDYYGD
jgi:hypothetical protein